MTSTPGRRARVWAPAGALFRALAGGLALTLTTLTAPAPAAAAPASPAPAGIPVTLTADHIEYNSTTGFVVADGHVVASQRDTTIIADHLRGNLKTEEIEATGHVVLIRGGQRATGDFVRYNYRTRIGRIEHVVTKFGPYNVASQAMDTAAQAGTAYNSTVTPCDPRHPAFAVGAARAVLVPGKYIVLYAASMFVYGVRLFTVPQYTIPLSGRQAAFSGGDNNLDGPWVEYRQSVPMGQVLGGQDLTDYFRVRYGGLSGFSGENDLVLQGPDHEWDLDVGRAEVFDQSGKLFHLDQYAVNLNYGAHYIPYVPGLPVTYTLSSHFGDYNETQSGVSTSRVEGRLDLGSETIKLTPEITVAAAAWSQYDAYGTGQTRTLTGATAAVGRPISQSSYLSLAYYDQTVVGSTPFLFDQQSPGSTLSLTYSYGAEQPRALLTTASLTFIYDFLALQTSTVASVALAVTPQFTLGVEGIYNLSLRTLQEVDYSLSGHCDCTQVNLVLKTFPNLGPSANQLFLSVSLTTLPQAAASVRLY